MEFLPLTAVSPIDGRYHSKTAVLADYFSEYALIRYRVYIEIEYFIALCDFGLPQLKGVTSDIYPALRSIYKCFSLDEAKHIMEIESVTNHDVMAV